MHMIHNRRRFLAGLSAAGAAGLLGGRTPVADEGRLEITTLRLPHTFALCIAPGYLADDLLRAEGFSEIRYVRSSGGFSVPQMIGRGEIDLGIIFAPIIVSVLDAGMPVTALAGLHSGCYELFAHEPIHTISDLKGRKVGIQSLSSATHLYVAIMSKHVGLDPHQDIDWATSPTSDPKEPMEMFASGRVDAFLGFPPEPQELRGRKIGRVILNTTTEKPWSQYFCCMLFGNRAFVRDHPVATKRALRAILKTADLCATEPETAARRLVDGGFSPRYDLALQTLSEVPYDRWREYDPEDSLRFYALRLHEVGMIQSSPNELLAAGTDWRFLDELKRELKA
jgi:NitT/TauT family transport system substrate-binding protein